MDVLVRLCEAGGEVLSSEQLLVDVWRGTFYGDNPVHKAVAQIRKALGEAPDAAAYIETVRKRGYRIAVPVRVDLARGGVASDASPTWSAGTPFRGLDPFEARHAAVFFGRDDMVSRCLDALASQQAARRSLVVVMGRSGSGKTSLLHAGLLPMLLRGTHGVRAQAVARMEPGQLPVASLARALTEWSVEGRPIFLPDEASDVEALVVRDAATLAARIGWAMQRARCSTRDDGMAPSLVLIVDPLEALFADDVDASHVTLVDEAIAALARHPDVIVLAACRPDFYPLLTERMPQLTALKGSIGHIDLPLLTPGELSLCVRGPARAAGLTFERDGETQEYLDDRLIADARRTPEMLPMLQHVLDRLFESRSRDGTLTFAAYASLGGLHGAIACHADTVLDALDADARAALPDVLSAVCELRLDSDAVVGRSAAWSAVAGTPGERLVNALVDARLFASDIAPDGRIFRVAHDALLRQWPRAVVWAEQNREWLHLQERVRVAARRWVADGRRSDMLWRSWRLAADADRLRRWPAVRLQKEDAAFIVASLGLVRRKRAAYAMTGLLVCLLSATSGVMAVRERLARGEAEEKRSQAHGLIEFALGTLADKLRPLGRLDMLKDVAQQALLVLAGSSMQASDPAASLQRLRALRTLVEVMLEQGELDAGARALHEASLLIAGLQDGAMAPRDSAYERSQLAYWQGLVAFRRKHLEQAGEAWRRYSDHASTLLELEPSNPAWVLEKSYALNNLGTLEKALGRFDAAIALFNASIELKRRHLGVASDPDAARSDLADSLSWLADTLERGGNPRAALPLMQEQLSLLLASEQAQPLNVLLRHRLALAHLRLGLLYAALGLDQGAIGSMSASARSLAQLAEGDPSNRTWRRDAGNAQLQLGWVLAATGELSAGRSWVRRSRATLQPLVTSDDAPAEWRRLAALAALRDATLHHGAAAADRLHEIEAVVVILEGLHRAAPDDRDTQGVLAAAVLAHADALAAIGDVEAARPAWRRAVDLARQGADASRLDRTAVETLVLGLRRLSDPEEASWMTALRRAEFSHPAFERAIDPRHARSSRH